MAQAQGALDRSTRAEATGLLSIGDLARATGVTPATLRVWETRFGFPNPLRLEGGHRRYSDRHAQAVLEIVRRREAGVRLDVAVVQVRAEMEAATRPSVFAGIREAHPSQPQEVWRQPTLLAVSRAIEDEVAAGAPHTHLFGGFQTARHYAASRRRWVDLAGTAASAHVFAHFPELTAPSCHDTDGGGPLLVALPEAAPMVREWLVVCDGPDLTVALLASDRPGQAGFPERQRVFEAMWTVDPVVVRDAARRCAETASIAGSQRATELLTGPLASPPRPGPDSARQVERLVHRMLRYLQDA